MTYAEFQEADERAIVAERERLSLLSKAELVQMIKGGRSGLYHQAFAALASKKDVRLAGPLLAERLKSALAFSQRLSCAYALLSLLPYSGIPAHALADPAHPGHGIYTEDLEDLLKKTLERLGP